ncbi:MAG: hypothetical protein AAF235_07950, partial [Planctomycetota bacterium]
LSNANSNAEMAAQWATEQLAELGAGRSRSIERVCVDADGAVCAPLTVSTRPLAMAEAERIAEGEGDTSELEEGMGGYDAAPRFPDLPGELTLQPLDLDDASAEAGPHANAPRLGVLAVPNAPARLLLDRLDSLGTPFERVVSIWHAVASAWDPAERTPREQDPLVISASGVVATVVVDHPESRVLWSWSQNGSLIASGTVRARFGSAPGQRTRLVDAPRLAGRISAEWLSWSAHLGVFPARARCIEAITTPAPEMGTDPALRAHDASTDPIDERTDATRAEGDAADQHAVNQNNRDESSTSASLASAIAKSWSTIAIEAIDTGDPLAATLRRYAEQVDAGRDAVASGSSESAASMTKLSETPGRVHKRMYRWLAVSLAVLGVALGAIGWNLRGSGSALDRTAATLRTQQREIIERIDPTIDPRFLLRAEDDIRASIERLKLVAAPVDPFEQVPPILEELDTLAFVIGSDIYELRRVNLNEFAPEIVILTDSVEQAEDLKIAFESIGGSNLEIIDDTLEAVGDRYRATFIFDWRDPEPIAPGANANNATPARR